MYYFWCSDLELEKLLQSMAQAKVILFQKLLQSMAQAKVKIFQRFT